ncbi:MAG: peptidylprolyl isomerase [Cytophagales bacterium]|nr:peptidylprolyl isomerase [Cytophagales bacterium]
MALINKIRQKSGWAIGFVAIGLGFFVVGGDILGPNSTILGKNKTDVGEIAGETIERERYQEQIDQIKYNYTINYGKSPSEGEMFSIRQQAWDYLIVKIAFQDQYDLLGLQVTDDEQWDMVQGNNVTFEIKQAFTDPQTGEFQRDRVINYLQQVRQLPAQQQASWYLFEQNLKPSRLRIKYDNLLVKTTYATSVEAKNQYNEEISVAEIKYLYVPYYSVSDSLVNVTDSELKDYLRDHQAAYEVEESRNFSYVSVPMVPSSEDTAYFQQEMDRLKEDFKSSTDDSLFARNNSDGDVFFTKARVDALPNMLQLNYSNLSVGDVRGPYFVGGNFTLYKVSEISEDTVGAVKASHILIKWTDESNAAKATARSKAQGILNQLRRGADFEQLARENSEDGSAQSGGDLGWFGPGKMVQPFEEAAFGATREGLISRLVETQFGYHIIKVTEKLNRQSYTIASIEREITPSEETRNKAFRTADYFASTSGNYDEFIANADRDSLQVYNAENVGKNDRRFNDVSNARSVVQWAYNDAEVGQVSDVKELDDQYIVAALTSITEDGPASLESVRDQIEPRVKNEKKGDIIIEKLLSMEGTLDELGENYGADARVYSSSDLKFSTNSLPSVGFAPLAVGTAFSLQGSERSAPVREENGIVLIEMINLTQAPEIADYSTYKNQIEQRTSSRVSYNAGEAIKKNADIKDLRFRFF